MRSKEWQGLFLAVLHRNNSSFLYSGGASFANDAEYFYFLTAFNNEQYFMFYYCLSFFHGKSVCFIH